MGFEAANLLLVARLAADDAVGRADMLRDVGAYMSHRLTPAEVRSAVDEVLASLLDRGEVTERRGTASLTAAGRRAALARIGARKQPADWGEVRDVHLVALALGIEQPPPRLLKAVARPDGLRSAIIARHYDLRLAPGASPARVRGLLAVVALERAFGNKIKGSIESGAGMPTKMSRMLAAQLLHKPRDPGTDARLLAALAAECVGAGRPTAEALRYSLIRNYMTELIGEAGRPDTKSATPPKSSVQVAAEAVTKFEPAKRPPAASRPDLAGFVREVHRAADAHAEGWPGNRKSFICHVWREIAARYPEWGLSEVEFKGMLAEAHRTGHLVLVNADLRDKSRLEELQTSAINYKNTVWHFVRLPA
jgi:hypothetical protein